MVMLEREKLSEIHVTERMQINRSVLLANAAGTIATISFIGAHLSALGNQGYGIGVFFVLIGFIAGAFFAWMGILCNWSSRNKELQLANYEPTDDNLHEAIRQVEISRKTSAIFIILSLSAFGASLFFGLFHLWQLA